MGLVKDMLKEQVRERLRQQMIQRQRELNPPRPTISQFGSNAAKNIVDITKGLVGLGYQAFRHPIESSKNVGAFSAELAKQLPSAGAGVARNIVEVVKNPIGSVANLARSVKSIRQLSLGQQQKLFESVAEQHLTEQERGKRLLGAFGSALLGDFIGEISHPVRFFYEKPVTFTLDMLALGQGTGINKATKLKISNSLDKVPAYKKMKEVVRETMTPYGKLINEGFEDVASKLSEAKGKIYQAQKTIIDDTSTKFYKDFKLTKKEDRVAFFDAIDRLRRSDDVPTSLNPDIQRAIDWYLKEEVPKIRKASGVAAERAISNYLHHYFPDRYKIRDTRLTRPLQQSERSYLKPSKDIEGFSKDPILSISAIKSKVEVDNIRDSLIDDIVKTHGKSEAEILDTLRVSHGDALVDRAISEGRVLQLIEENTVLKPYYVKGKTRTFPATTESGDVVRAVTKNKPTTYLPAPIADELTNFVKPKTGTFDKLLYPFDVFNRNWKPLATAVRLRYHTRNVVGNIYNAVVIGGTPLKTMFTTALAQQVKGHIAQAMKEGGPLGRFYTAIFKKPPGAEDLKLAVDNDVVGRGFFGADLNDLQIASKNGDDIIKMLRSINTPAEIYHIPILRHWLGFTHRIGQFLEDNARLAMFIEGMKRTGGDIPKSKKYVNDHLFDYITGLSDADRYIKRIVPFWSWTRFNVPLQAGALAKMPARHLLIQKLSTPYAFMNEASDPGFENLSEEQQRAGFIKVGEEVAGNKTLDKYIKTASVLPQADLVRMIDIIQGKDEEIGFTPLVKIFRLIFTDPTTLLNYFGQPIERFTGERKKFFGVSVRGRTKELLSTIPIFTELNKLFAGSYPVDDRPNVIARLEQVISPTGATFVDREKTKFFKELEEQKKVHGSYTGGLLQLYKNYLKRAMASDDPEAYIKDNIELLEAELKREGVNPADLVKVRARAIRALIDEKLRGAIANTDTEPNTQEPQQSIETP